MTTVCEGASSLWLQEVNRGGLLRLEKEVMTRLEKSRSEQLNVKRHTNPAESEEAAVPGAF